MFATSVRRRASQLLGLKSRCARLASPLTSLFILTICLCVDARASDMQEFFPDNNVSWRPFVEFRARGPADFPRTGHAFVVLGFEGDNSTRVYKIVAGFYPDPKSKLDEAVKVIAPIGGHLDYHYEDMHDDVYFRTYITHQQAYSTVFILQQWNEKQYSLPFQNCVSMVTAVARSLGLKVPDLPEKMADLTALWPVPFVRYLAEKNSTDQTAAYTGHAQTVIDKKWSQMSDVMRNKEHDEAISRDRAKQQNGMPLGPMPPASPSHPPDFDGYFELLH